VNVGDSVRKAIDDWEDGEVDAAMLHACNAVDGTGAKLDRSKGNNARFTGLLRDNYGILGPMCAPGINLTDTRFPVRVNASKAPGGQPDFADVIYGIHRCHHGHGEHLPEGFELLPDAAGPAGVTRMEVRAGVIRLSDRVIFGLLAVAVMSPANLDQRVPDGYYLTLEEIRLDIDHWWGRAADFPALAARVPMPLIKLDFGDWMQA
jgi:hypothetical protein